MANSVLIVDDDPEMLYYCAYLMASYGYKVTVAPNGKRAQEQMSKQGRLKSPRMIRRFA